MDELQAQEQIACVCVDLMQRLPYKSNFSNKSSYRMFSHFDMMTLQLVQATDVVLEGSNVYDKDQRLYTPCEAHKLFLYSEPMLSDAYDRFCRFISGPEHEKPSDWDTYLRKPLLALIGVKLCRCFFADDTRTHDDMAFKCIDSRLHAISNQYGGKYEIMHSLGVEDLYILYRGANPENMLKAIFELRNERCCHDENRCPPEGKRRKVGTPIVLETHTHIGYWEGIHDIPADELLQKLPEESFDFELQLRQMAPVGVEEIEFTMQTQYGFESVLRTAGSYGLVARGRITLYQLFQLYQEPFLNWSHEDYYNILVTSSTGRFFCKTSNDAQNCGLESDYLRGRKDLYDTDEHVEGFLEQFQALNKEGLFSKNQVDVIEALIRIYIQGMQRLFHTNYWGVFRDIRHFLKHFFERLEQEIIWITMNPPSIDMFITQVEQFSDSVSAVLNERLLLGRPMQENARLGVYATGAHEDLIQLYRLWIRQLRELYTNACAGKGDYQNIRFHALFVPLTRRDIKTQELFPFGRLMVEEHRRNGQASEPTLQILALFHMGAQDLWEFRDSLIVLTHEVSHYLFSDEVARCKLLLEMVTTHFARELESHLVSLPHPCLKVDTFGQGINTIKDALRALLEKEVDKKYCDDIEACRDQRNCVEVMCLPRYAEYIKDVLIDVLEAQLPPNVPGVCSQKQCNNEDLGVRLIRTIENTYRRMGLYSFFENRGNLRRLLEQTMDQALDTCYALICEACADLVAVSALNQSFEQYAGVIWRAQYALLTPRRDMRYIDRWGVAFRFAAAAKTAAGSDLVRARMQLTDAVKDSDGCGLLKGILEMTIWLCTEAHDGDNSNKMWRELWGLFSVYMDDSNRKLNACFNQELMSGDSILKDLRATLTQAGTERDLQPIDALMRFMHRHVPYQGS